jgi:glycosyltransferase involved in cell wall biosynthesis
LAAARNTAVASCHGEFVFHVDADDWIEPNAISVLVKRQQETDADIVYTSRYYKFNKEDVAIDCHGWSSDKKALLLNILQDKATICVWSKLFRKTLYTDNDIWCDERGSFYEDFQVLPRLVYYSNIIECLDKCIYHYNRSNPKSLVTNLSRNIEIQKQGLLSIQTILDFFHDKEHNYLDSVKRFYLCYTYKMLNANFRHKNRKGYFDFLRLLNQTDRQYWDQIGWNKPWRRLNDHYNYLRLFIQ